MPIVSDYVVLMDGHGRSTDTDTLTLSFDAGGVERGGGRKAILSMNISSNGEGDVTILINGQNVGVIKKYHDMNARNWFGQTFVFNASVLKRRDNVLRIEIDHGNIRLRDIVCHFNQSA